MLYLGIDPGWQGALTIYNPTNHNVEVYLMPQTVTAVVQLFNSLPTGIVRLAAVERVQGYIGRPQPGSRMFRFGENFGVIQACLISAGVPHILLTPQQWRRRLGIAQRVQNKSRYLKALIDVCERLIPGCRADKQSAESILLAFCAYQYHQGINGHNQQ